MTRITFSVNTYDRDGDIATEGIFLHFGDTTIKVAANLEEFESFINCLSYIKAEIKENL